MQRTPDQSAQSLTTVDEWQIKINEIRAKQSAVLSGKKFGEVDFELQCQWSVLQRELGITAFRAFQTCIDQDKMVAVAFFEIAYLARNDYCAEFYKLRAKTFMPNGEIAHFALQEEILAPYARCDAGVLYQHALVKLLTEGAEQLLSAKYMLMKAYERKSELTVTAKIMVADYLYMIGQQPKAFVLYNEAIVAGSSYAKRVSAFTFFHDDLEKRWLLLNEAAADGEMGALRARAQKIADQFGNGLHAEQLYKLAELQGDYHSVFPQLCFLDIRSRDRKNRDLANNLFLDAAKALDSKYGGYSNKYHRSVFHRLASETAALLMAHPELKTEFTEDFTIYYDSQVGLLDYIYAVLDQLNASEHSRPKCRAFVLSFLEFNKQTQLRDQQRWFAIQRALISRLDMMELRDMASISLVLENLTDSWFFILASDLPPDEVNHHKKEITDCIIKLIFNIAGRDLTEVNDNEYKNVLRQCCVMLVKSACGDEYDVMMADISFSNLLAFAGLIKAFPAITAEDLNNRIGGDFMRRIPLDEILDLLTRANALPAFASYLETHWKNAVNRDEATQRKVIKHLVQAASAALKSSKREPSNLFSPRTDEYMQMLAAKNFHGLLSSLKATDISYTPPRTL